MWPASTRVFSSIRSCDQLLSGSFLHKRQEPGNEVVGDQDISTRTMLQESRVSLKSHIACTHLTNDKNLGGFVTGSLWFGGMNFLEELIENPHQGLVVFWTKHLEKINKLFERCNFSRHRTHQWTDNKPSWQTILLWLKNHMQVSKQPVSDGLKTEKLYNYYYKKIDLNYIWLKLFSHSNNCRLITICSILYCM